jgi:2-oxoglutarate/2-oxoacid ferredoxin oxidoreductase subunit beta
MTENPKYSKKDFASDQEVRWCPGCGDYAILNAVQMACTKINRKREDIVFISGIGCSSRFPYYMGTYGLHTIHGRAPGFASGLKAHNPDLSIWLITGDGDGLSIGGNHLIHAIRRNIDMNMILFNNEIYGLTKGQYSPTSQIGTVTKSSPFGSVDRSFLPSKLALGAGATFYARTMDTDPKHMQEVFLAAEEHRGLAFVEILQNCVIFNDKIHDNYTNRKTRDDHVFFLKHGEPITFGKEKNQGLRQNGPQLEIVTIGENGVEESDLVVHNEKDNNLANMLANLRPHVSPVPMGILHRVEDVYYDKQICDQVDAVIEKKGKGDMNQVLNSGATWEVD